MYRLHLFFAASFSNLLQLFNFSSVYLSRPYGPPLQLDDWYPRRWASDAHAVLWRHDHLHPACASARLFRKHLWTHVPASWLICAVVLSSLLTDLFHVRLLLRYAIVVFFSLWRNVCYQIRLLPLATRTMNFFFPLLLAFCSSLLLIWAVVDHRVCHWYGCRGL